MKNAYVIFDLKAKLYNAPFFLLNDQVALRTAQQLVEDPKSEVFHHPEDYAMFKIGSYDDQSGIFSPSQHDVICRFHELPDRNVPLGAHAITGEIFENLVQAVASVLNPENVTEDQKS